jgi:bacteriorhodopsin
MSNLEVVGMIMALGIAHTYLYMYANIWLQDLNDMIATGVVRGVAVSLKRRRLMLSANWVCASGLVVGFMFLFSMGYGLIGQYTVEGVKIFAYLFAFLSFIGMVGWIVFTPFHYVQLRSELRQAEAD